jgi:hypothetical protein
MPTGEVVHGFSQPLSVVVSIIQWKDHDSPFSRPFVCLLNLILYLSFRFSSDVIG